ncbi:thiamine pyrophosphate-dependent enzyme, partial [Alphaproteobacteria bacterium]|nr:thiamine pyrophosphate-dependent enzyme [Alphaproteobacteria bacterium]
QDHDSLFLTHRNIHYNLARLGSLKEELNEYHLKKSGLAKGKLGSMNLSNPDKNIIYSSSILGNNLAVGSGFALANKLKNHNGVVFIVTGDGAIEEGAFYESLLFLKSNKLPSVIIVENNEWSLGTKIAERRANIDLNLFAKSFDIDYQILQKNDPFDYIDKLNKIRACSIASNSPLLVEVKLTTLGYWFLKNKDFPKGKFINYHAGPAPELNITGYPLIKENDEDPLYVLTKYIEMDKLIQLSSKQHKKLLKDIS